MNLFERYIIIIITVVVVVVITSFGLFATIVAELILNIIMTIFSDT